MQLKDIHISKLLHVHGVISTQNSKPLKLVDLGSNISSTQRDVNICIEKAQGAIDKLPTT